MADNTLYYGDNLDILRRYIKDESVDLVYLDPPFNSNVDYNVLFKERDGKEAASQIKAFKDTWNWSLETEFEFQMTIEKCPFHRAVEALSGLRRMLGQSDLMAYLVMMASRLIELRRVLRKKGSLYLHCDPTASHYLKVLLDAIFGPQNFRSEVVWKRSSAHSDTKQGCAQHGRIHDVLLFYTCSDEWTWNPLYTPYDEAYLATEYRHKSRDGRFYKETDATAAKPGGDTEFDWHVMRLAGAGERWQPDESDGCEPQRAGYEYRVVRPYAGRYWAYSKSNLREFWKQGRLVHRETGMPRIMQFADDMPGVSLQDIWTDIPPESGSEDLGYPTQKPIALMERILATSSNLGDVILDPFCGCGTTVAAAQKLGRKWVGIDITHLAVMLIKKRLDDSFGPAVRKQYVVVGEPTDVAGARELAKQDRFQFQYWALGLVGARPYEQKKGADQGIDGRLYFHDEAESGKTKQIILSVKSGKLKATDVRDLRAVIDREQAAIGVLISLEDFSKPMQSEAASVGFYDSPWGGKHPRLQLLTIQDLFDGKKIDMPPVSNLTFKKAPKAKPKKSKGKRLPFSGDAEY